MVKMITSKSVFILWDSFASWGTCCFNVLGRLKILRIRKHLIVHEKNWFYKFQVIWADETTTKSEWSTWIFCDLRLSTDFRSHFIILRMVPLWHSCLKVKIICSNPSLTLNLNFHPVLLEICMVHLLWTQKNHNCAWRTMLFPPKPLIQQSFIIFPFTNLWVKYNQISLRC